MADEKKDEDLVLTPGGRHKRELVHSVHPGEAVRADEMREVFRKLFPANPT